MYPYADTKGLIIYYDTRAALKYRETVSLIPRVILRFLFLEEVQEISTIYSYVLYPQVVQKFAVKIFSTLGTSQG